MDKHIFKPFECEKCDKTFVLNRILYEICEIKTAAIFQLVKIHMYVFRWNYAV